METKDFEFSCIRDKKIVESCTFVDRCDLKDFLRVSEDCFNMAIALSEKIDVWGKIGNDEYESTAYEKEISRDLGFLIRSMRSIKGWAYLIDEYDKHIAEQ